MVGTGSKKKPFCSKAPTDKNRYVKSDGPPPTKGDSPYEKSNISWQDVEDDKHVP